MTKAIRNITSVKNSINSKNLTIIIPSAGEGSRMKTHGAKSLIKLTPTQTILDYQVYLIRQIFPDSTIILISGYESNRVINRSPKNIIHIENERHETTNVVRSIGIGLKATITDNVLIIYGDLVCNKQTLSYPLEKKSVIFVDSSNTMTENEVGCNIVNGNIEWMVYDATNKWAQIIYLTGKELQLLKQICNDVAYEKTLGFEAINEIINKGGKFKAAIPEGIKANDVDCSKDLYIAQSII
jgi:choline kinase